MASSSTARYACRYTSCPTTCARRADIKRHEIQRHQSSKVYCTQSGCKFRGTTRPAVFRGHLEKHSWLSQQDVERFLLEAFSSEQGMTRLRDHSSHLSSSMQISFPVDMTPKRSISLFQPATMEVGDAPRDFRDTSYALATSPRSSRTSSMDGTATLPESNALAVLPGEYTHAEMYPSHEEQLPQSALQYPGYFTHEPFQGHTQQLGDFLTFVGELWRPSNQYP